MCVCGEGWAGTGREIEMSFCCPKAKLSASKTFFFCYQKTEFLLAEVLGKTSRFALDVV